jgi:hypothetical protein
MFIISAAGCAVFVLSQQSASAMKIASVIVTEKMLFHECFSGEDVSFSSLRKL